MHIFINHKFGEVMKIKAILSVLSLLLFVSLGFAQVKEHETNSAVPELEKFHEVIYQIWHTAWPEKDVKMLKDLLPEVEKGYKDLAKAELPGILRDKKGKWDEGMKKLTAAFEAYKKATASDEKQPLLDAAEKLHANYEGMVRVVRPVLKEVDAFHQDLYSLYHYYSPEFKLDKIKKASAALSKKIEGMQKAQLSEKQKTKKDAYDKSVAELEKAVKEFAAVVKTSKDKAKIQAAVESVHAKYQLVEKVFE
jgi:hypothetical protein